MSQVPEIIGVGAPALNPSSEDRNPSSAAYPSPAEKKAIVKNADMNDHMQAEAVEIAIYAFEKYGVEKEVAEHIKKEFDNKHGATWHCIVGKNFGYRLPCTPLGFHLTFKFSIIGGNGCRRNGLQ
ncbi:hypothetical protein LguiA_031216 [Lonicera macranthoides]